jgi:hypothetical protein
MPPLWQGNGTDPAPHLHPYPKLINFHRSVTLIYRNLCVTSDVQFRKGAAIPSFWVGLSWAGCEQSTGVE